jgi:hypothetical protein
MVFTVFRLLTDFVCLYNYEFWLSHCKIVRSSVILLLPLYSNRQPSSVLAVRYKQCDHMNAKSVMTTIPDKFDLNQLWWAVRSSDLAHCLYGSIMIMIEIFYLPFLCCDLILVFAHLVLRNSPFGFLDFGFLLEWWFRFWFLWKYGELNPF